MRGNGRRGVIAENLTAFNGYHLHQMNTSKKFRMCWKCQKDKSTKGGHIKLFTGGTAKFICKECMDAKKDGSTKLG